MSETRQNNMQSTGIIQAGQERCQVDHASVFPWEGTNGHSRACEKLLYCQSANPRRKVFGAHQTEAILTGSAFNILEYDFRYFSGVWKAGLFSPPLIEDG